jgi:hypothetical protein
MRPVAAWMVLLFAVALFQGCRDPKSGGGAEPPNKPTVRLYLLSTLAGALEPCGCSKDQLGGLDHLAAYLDSQREPAPERALLAAGPLFFIDSQLDARQATQDKWKAEAIARTLQTLGLRAWAPGYNDWAAGPEAFKENAELTGATALGVSGQRSSQLLSVGGLKIGVVGVSDPQDRGGRYPKGVSAPGQVVPAVKRELEALQGQGAQLFVVLAAMQRGAALRIADAVPEIHVLLIGKPHAEGDGNTTQAPAEMIGSTLVVETANHGQTVAVVDVYTREPGEGRLKLVDAGGVSKAAQVVDLSGRIRDLEHRINGWEKGGKVDAKDLAARKAELDKLRQERKALEAEQPAPPGSFFRYRVEEVREGLGESADVAKQILAYYKRVNVHNKTALADLVPTKPGKDEAHYVGVDACTNCHLEEREVWDKTTHATAYKTLVKGFKEYNLDCVSCHVTGYGKPGGSTVTHNDDLRGVQCETCHGPGSKHVDLPEDKALITLEPDPKSCVAECHHPPHVEGFDPKAKMELVLGKGHGRD